MPEENVTLGPWVTPAPSSEYACGLPTLLSVRTKAADRGPRTLGEKVTVIEHVPPGLMELPQALVAAKSEDPVDTSTITSGSVPLFVSDRVCAGLDVPFNCIPNDRLDAEETSVSGSKRMETV